MFLVHDNQRDYKKLVISGGKTVGVDKVPTQTQFEMPSMGYQSRMKLLRNFGS